MKPIKFVLASIAIAITGLVVAAPAVASPNEDQQGWSCVRDGNRICGPHNGEAVPAGCYDDRGAMVAAWPCSVVVNADGSSDVYFGLEGN